MERRKIKWQKFSNFIWKALDHRGYTGQITDSGSSATPYQLLIQPGAVATSHPTLKAAKNQYRLYLLDKPANY